MTDSQVLYFKHSIEKRQLAITPTGRWVSMELLLQLIGLYLASYAND